MKQIGMEKAVFDVCIREAPRERVVLTRMGRPVALVVGLEEMDMENLELCRDDKFWKLITHRRTQKTITRAELEERLKRLSV